MIIAPSILSADFAALGDAVSTIDNAGADWIHIDVMDGVFVPNLTIGPMVVKALRPHTEKPFDVHLMISRPEDFVEPFAKAGADYITVHYESTNHLHRLVTSIRDLGKKPGVSINPATPASVLEEILPFIDLVLVMSVNPGFGGQSFIETSLGKVQKIRNMCDAMGLDTIIEVDGGVTDANAKRLREAGANALVAGSYVFGASDYAAAINSLRD